MKIILIFLLFIPCQITLAATVTLTDPGKSQNFSLQKKNGVFELTILNETGKELKDLHLKIIKPDFQDGRFGKLDDTPNYNSSVTRAGTVLNIWNPNGLGDPTFNLNFINVENFSPNFSITPSFDGKEISTPLPAAIWLFGSGLLGLVGTKRIKKITNT